MTGHEVFFILGDFEGDLWSLSRAHHVWLIKSKQNSELAGQVWAREAHDNPPWRGVTTFDGSGDRMADFYGFLGTIDGHHDEHSAPVAWSVIHVRGVRREDANSARIAEELDADVEILPEAGGFAILRQPNQG